MDPLQYFDEEYSKIQKSVGSLSALFLQAKDMYSVISSVHKALLSVKSDFSDSPTFSAQLDSIIDSLQSFLVECKNFTYDLELATKSIKNLKDY
jgi:hypothetical protein